MGRVCYCIRYLVSVILVAGPLCDCGVAGARIGVTDISRSLGPGIRNLGLMFAMDMVPGTDISMRQVMLRIFPCLCLSVSLPLRVSACLCLWMSLPLHANACLCLSVPLCLSLCLPLIQASSAPCIPSTSTTVTANQTSPRSPAYLPHDPIPRRPK